MPNRDSAHEVVAGLYDAALEPEAWPRALSRLSRECGAVSAHLLAFEPATKAVLFSYLGGERDEAELTDYEAHYRFIDPRIAPSLALPAGDVRPQAALIDEGDFLSSEFFNDFYARCGLRDQACAMLERNGEAVVLLGLHRALSQTPYDNADMTAIRRFMPHVARAASVHLRCTALEAQVARVTAAFDRLAVGVVLVDDRGRVVLVNAAARRIAAQADGLFLMPSGLAGARAQDSAALARAVGQVVCPQAEPFLPAPLSVARPSGKRAYQVLVAPLPAGLARRHRRTGGALVLISDPEAAPVPPSAALARLYGLTRAEARVAAALAAGQPLREIAEAAGYTREAARWHLKHIYEKTGIHRQAELVKLLRGGPLGAVRLDDADG